MWNLAVTKPLPGPEVVEAIRALEFEGEAAQYVIEQIEAAKQAAIELFNSGAIGAVDDPALHYHVTLSGHANADHVPTPGYDNDTLSVHVVQMAVANAANVPGKAPAEPGAPAPPADPVPENSPSGEPAPATPVNGEEAPAEEDRTEGKTPPIPASEGGAS
jgi:hypothetical protein